jgi:hypothetical protein
MQSTKATVKIKSPASELRKNKIVGGKPGIPTVRACHHPAKPVAYAGFVNHEPVFVTT